MPFLRDSATRPTRPAVIECLTVRESCRLLPPASVINSSGVQPLWMNPDIIENICFDLPGLSKPRWLGMLNPHDEISQHQRDFLAA
jgi:hypothetical protein